jgi:hypothetical protein
MSANLRCNPAADSRQAIWATSPTTVWWCAGGPRKSSRSLGAMGSRPRSNAWPPGARRTRRGCCSGEHRRRRGPAGLVYRCGVPRLRRGRRPRRAGGTGGVRMRCRPIRGGIALSPGSLPRTYSGKLRRLEVKRKVMTHSSGSLRTGIPIVQIRVDGDHRHDNGLIATAARDGG